MSGNPAFQLIKATGLYCPLQSCNSHIKQCWTSGSGYQNISFSFRTIDIVRLKARMATAGTTDTVAGLKEQLEKLLEDQKVLVTNSDQFFLIVIAIIIFFMQCGFAFLEAGSVR